MKDIKMHKVFSNLDKNPRTVEAVRHEYAELLAQSNKVVATAKGAGRHLNADENAQVESLCMQMAVLTAEENKLVKDADTRENFERMLNTGQVAIPTELGGGGPGASWQTDSRGCKYAILNKGDRASSILPSSARNEFGHFVLAKIFGPTNATPHSVRMALTGDQNSLGGFLVPEQLFGGIIDLARAKSVLMAAGTRTLLMSTDTLLVPTLQSDVVVKLRGENDPIHRSDNTFGQIRMQAKNAGVLTKMSRELAEDAPELLAEQIGMLLVAAMVETIDRWGLNGAAGLEPTGLYARDIESTGAIGPIDWLDVSRAALEVRSRNHEPTSVILSPQRYADLFEAESGDGTNSARNWLDRPPTLKDVQFLQTTNNPDDKLLIGDFSRYALGLRTSPLVEATSTGGDSFENHQIHVKITCRFDFAPLDQKAFHKLEGITD